MIKPSSRFKAIARRLLAEGKVLAPLLLLIVLCLIPKSGGGTERERLEFFPFSHFPMYSAFDERDYYVFVTGEDGNPIATETLIANCSISGQPSPLKVSPWPREPATSAEPSK